MARMYRVLGFWTLIIALMALAGHMTNMALLFFAQTAVFMFLGYMNLKEKTYMYLFWGYMLVAFFGITYWSFFRMTLPV